MDAKERLITDPFRGTMIDRLTEYQALGHARAAGRWQSDVSIGTGGVLHHVRVSPDGVAEMTRCQSNDEAWWVNGHQMPGDMMVGRL
jgi:hypothetical protein